MVKGKKMVKASELLKKIEDGEWEAEVVDDEDCYPEFWGTVPHMSS